MWRSSITTMTDTWTFTSSTARPSLASRKNRRKYWNRLFHNNHDGTFTDVTEKAGVKGEGYDIGVAVGDYDNDGWPDIFLANVTANQLFHNNHDGTFTDVTGKAGVARGGAGRTEDVGCLRRLVRLRQRWPARPVRLELLQMGSQQRSFLRTQSEVRAYCHPKNYAPLPNTLYHNNGDGTFTDVSAETAGISQIRGKGMGIVFADYDHDGFTDVFVANDNARTCSSTISAARNSKRWRCRPASRIPTPDPRRCRVWAPISGTLIMTAMTICG